MQCETHRLLDKLGLDFVEVVADRRDTLVIRVIRNGDRMILKLHGDGGTEETQWKGLLLKNEAKVLSKIPCLTNDLYIGHGVCDSRSWLLIRDVEGLGAMQAAKDIRSRTSDRHQRTKALIALLCKVSAFYDRLYRGNYLHRDIQAGHIYLENGDVTVIDWGLAGDRRQRRPLYKGGFVYYVAPEVAASMRTPGTPIIYTPRAEVYSLGVVLFLLYTGSFAVDFGVPLSELKNVPMDAKLAAVIANKVSSFEVLGADPHPELESLLKRSLSTDPMHRLKTPIAFHRELCKIGRP